MQSLSTQVTDCQLLEVGNALMRVSRMRIKNTGEPIKNVLTTSS